MFRAALAWGNEGFARSLIRPKRPKLLFSAGSIGRAIRIPARRHHAANV